MIVQATCGKGAFRMEDGSCVHTDPDAWELAVLTLGAGRNLTYGGTQGPDNADDHWVVHVWHVDFVSPVKVPSSYVEPASVAQARKEALDVFDPATVTRPQPAPFDFESAMERPVPPSWPDTDPEPEHTTRDPFPDGFEIPSSVTLLVRKAEAAGWTVKVGYSRGFRRAQKTGTFDRIETLGVWAAPHPDSGWRFSAMYERKPDGGPSAQKWKWGGISLWRDGTFPFPYCNSTELKEWITVRASVLPSWFEQVKKRVRDAEAKQKAAAKSRTATAREVS